MSVLEKLGGAVGTVVGTVIGGPFGSGAGSKVGEFVGEALDEAAGQTLDPPSPKPPPPPKPAIKSRTVWFNLLFSLAVALLTWVAGYQWDQLVDPTLAVVIASLANILLRIVSSGAIGPEE